jgi:hypothetical protein
MDGGGTSCGKAYWRWCKRLRITVYMISVALSLEFQERKMGCDRYLSACTHYCKNLKFNVHSLYLVPNELCVGNRETSKELVVSRES